MAPNFADSQAQPTGASSGAAIVIDHNHPLFLHASDVSGVQIVSFQLTGIENYSVWFRSMKIALLGRNKLGMVDGSLLSWIMNSVSKSLLGGIMYASNARALKGLWEEFEALVPAPGCACAGSKEYVVHLQTLKLFQFLMGLNDSYLQARSQILMLKPVPTVN
ncbi:hypothetical protein R3W88_018191 [Solanum pinnatisectum]|uniref:Retrotransposon Copia-like N-terminal domain-containing protein n=1 Tax=Solanum pinnatisectum TaxID=50273 RepID=A0AAV9L349_9SOLN|nr:hypothetical protein R3W88_018191 [Solanum pinnatisectum]